MIYFGRDPGHSSPFGNFFTLPSRRQQGGSPISFIG
jgi:hypothetical protein